VGRLRKAAVSRQPGIDPHHYTLDGLFGAYEVSAWQRLSAAVEYDTEKVNGMLGINLGYGFRARVAALDLKHMALGAGWFKAL
jgi:hypothetical protein